MGLRFVERDRSEVPARVVEHLDALYAAVTGLALVDGLVGASLQARFMMASLRSGHGVAIGAAAALEATHLATRGGREESPRERALAKLAGDIAERMPPLERPTQALQAMASMRSFLRGRWREAYEAHESANNMLPASRGIWNAHAVAVYAEFALGFLGEPAELARRLPGLLTDAERRGDRLKVVNLRTGVAPLVYLAKDDPEAARRHVVGSIAQWSQRGFLIQHWRAMIAEADIYLYEGKGALAYERLARSDRALRRSMLEFAQYLRAVTAFARARSAVASALDGGSSSRARLREAARIARKLEREATPWIARARVPRRGGRRQRRGARRRGVRAPARRVRAGPRGRHGPARSRRASSSREAPRRATRATTLVQEAADAMRAKGVHAPERYASMLLPGQWGPRNPASPLPLERTFPSPS